jgi:dolichyl-phosphate-mannose--protein O-mannosyl transferase
LVTPAATADTTAITDADTPAAEAAATAPHGEDTPEPASAPSGRVPPVVRRRLLPFDARLDPYSWVATGVVGLIAAILRLVGLGHPPGKIFDETYYAKDAWGLIQRGVEWNYKDNAPSYVVHPPLGKWLIGLGEWAFGYADPDSHVKAAGHLTTTAPEFGWRISAAIAGIASVLILTRLARRLFHSTILGCAAGLLMALDGMHLVLSRTALLDIFLMLFVLAAFAALVIDRDVRRRRWLTAMAGGLDPSQPGPAGRLPFRFPGSVPWWRLLAAVLLGCALAVKWSAIWFVPVFALLAWVWEAGARKSAGVRRPWRDAIIDEFGWFLLFGVLIVATYLAGWTGWFLTDDGYFRHWLADTGHPEPPIIGALQNLLHYHEEAYKFHTTLHAEHKYQSWPWQWLLLGRPVAFYWSSQGPCGASSCASEVVLLGTPVLWWSFLPALAGLAWVGIARRDWRAGAIGLVVAAGLLPWFYYALDGRTMFFFYALPAEPFLVLAVVYVLGAIMTPVHPHAASSVDRRLVGAVVAGSYVLLVAVCFAYFYPIFIGQHIPYADWSARMWLGGRWI